jgi:pilus assembly protein CpaD
VSTYRPSDPTIASPIRLSFAALKAKVASTCGLWPQDLGVSDPGFNMRNEPYWNLGCATQANMAAQVADPVDLVRGRQEGLADATRRAKDVENIRQGKDPSTQFRQDGRNRINQAVGN